MSALMDLMDTWLIKKSKDPLFAPEKYTKSVFIRKPVIEIIMPEKPMSHYSMIMAEKRKKEEEELIQRSLSERNRLDWKHIKDHPYLIHS